MLTRRLFVPMLCSAALVVTGAPIAAGGESPGAAPAPSERRAPGSWTEISTGRIANTNQPTLLRTSNGQLHIVHGKRIGASDYYDQVLVSRAGSVVGRNPVLGPWNSLPTDPVLALRPDGGLHLSFSGIQDNNVGNFFSKGKGYYATSDATGLAWNVPAEGTVASGASSSTGSDALVLDDGTPVTSGAQIGGVWWRAGTYPAAAVTTATDQTIPWPCCAYNTSLARVGSSVWLAWSSNASSRRGLYVKQILPAEGPEQLVPRSVTNGSSLDPGARVAMVARPDGSVVMAYRVGYPTTKYVALWEVGTSRVRKVPGSKGAYKVSLGVAPDGKLWTSWYVNGPDRVRAVRTSERGFRFGGVSTVRYPGRNDSVYQISSEASAATLDVVVNTGDALWHRKVRAALQLSARPRSWRAGRSQVVRFTVKDAGERIRGAKVKAGGKRCRTNGRGVCSIRLPASRPRQVRATAVKRFYDPGTVKLRVRR